jgi:UDP:flavonoid glycosyltransferase YjiC (YdhE family)
MRFLFTTFEGGGHVAPALLVAKALRLAGHEVLFVSDEANRRAAQCSGLAFASWKTAPNRQTLGDNADPLRDWKPRLPHAIVGQVCQAVMTGPAERYAMDALAMIERFAPDVVVSNELLLGVMAAGEAANVPVALLTSNVWCYPTRTDVPPFGPGFAPWGSPAGQRRDRIVRQMISGWYDVGLEDLNRARARLGLGRLSRCLDQLDRCAQVLLGVSQAFDYGVATAPPGFVYVGPLGQTPDWVERGDANLDLIDPRRPNVLVSFSTTHQNQAATVKRTISALARLDVKAIVTLGPAIRARGLPTAKNVTIVARADHDVLVPLCDLVVCHGGHGTVMRPLIHGKPVICLPTGRDQPDNAQRIAAAGAGLRLPRGAGSWRIARAIRRVLSQTSFTSAAQALGAAIARDDVGPAKAVATLEAMVMAARPAAQTYVSRSA